jgi:hypothetical protein
LAAPDDDGVAHGLASLGPVLQFPDGAIEGEAGIDVARNLRDGGFARLVHRHDTERIISLRAEFSTPASLERFGRDLTNFPFPDLDDEVESAWLELAVSYRKESSHVGPVVESVTVGVCNYPDPLVWADTAGHLRSGDPLYIRVNFAHPMIRASGLDVRSYWEEWHWNSHGGTPPYGG